MDKLSYMIFVKEVCRYDAGVLHFEQHNGFPPGKLKDGVFPQEHFRGINLLIDTIRTLKLYETML